MEFLNQSTIVKCTTLRLLNFAKFLSGRFNKAIADEDLVSKASVKIKVKIEIKIKLKKTFITTSFLRS